MQDYIFKAKISSLYLGVFILAVSEAIVAYFQSTYLNQFFGLSLISFIFIITYLITFFTINKYPNLIARFNNFTTAICSLVIKAISLIIFIFSSVPFLIFLGFILFTVSFNLIFINLDIFLEAFTTNIKTGRIRGTYFTIYNLGWLCSPFMAGQILERLGFTYLYGLDLFLTVLVSIIVIIGFHDFANHYLARHFEMRKTIKEILRRLNIKKIFYIALLLNFFYAVMLVYTPIYLNKHIGLAWGEIGLIFTFMLLPFVILQYPAGYLADKYIGEKEMLTIGLIIMSIASFFVFFLNTKCLLIWGLVLFFSRIGASLVEIMRESYFFKKVDVGDIDLINALRSTTPLSYIIAPLIVGLLLYFLPLKYIFLILCLFILTGLSPALTLKDTK